MATFQAVETFLGAPMHMLSGITDMVLVRTGAGLRLYTATRPGGGVLALSVGAEIGVLDIEATAAGSVLPAPGQLELLSVAGKDTLLVMGGATSRLSGFALGADGTMGTTTQIAGTLSGVIASQATVRVGTETFLYLNRMSEGTIWGYRLLSGGRAELVSDTPAQTDLQGVDVAAMASLKVGGANFLLALSAAEDSLRSFKVQADGGLVAVSNLGARGGLGISAPSALTTVTLEGVNYALVAGAGSSSISVVAVEPTGRLTVTDHVIDTRDTRFQGVQALATVTLGDRVFLFAGGGDDGVNLFTLLPGGRLLLLGTRLRSDGLPLDNITALAATPDGDGGIELFAAGEGRGLMRLRVDPGPLAPILTGGAGADDLTGTTAGDMILGQGGDDTLLAGSGDDILVDGAGTDVLSGGAGADIFVLGGDGAADIIRDFQPGIDRLDLSGWGRVYSVDALEYAPRENGATLTFRDETLLILSANGQPIPKSAFTSSDLFGLWHVVASAPVEGRRIEGSPRPDVLEGDMGDDTLVGSPGPDLLDGGGGFDLVDYSLAEGPLVVDLDAPEANAGLAEGDRHLSIEGVIGGGFDDRIAGDAHANLLRGGGGADILWGRGGDDRLYGGAGDDTLTGGPGADRLFGGVGVDRVQYGDSPEGLTIDLQSPAANTGWAAGDRFDGIEEVAGSAHGDRIFGTRYGERLLGLDEADHLVGRNGADALYGGDGDDTLQGDAGNDSLYGGAGNDWAFFVTGSGVVLDLTLTTAQATVLGADVLIGIEHLRTGSGHDRLVGNRDANHLLGDAGHDTLEGGEGDDTLAGGAGDDLLDGAEGADWAVYSGPAATVDLLLAGPQVTGHGADRLIGIENLQGGDGGNRFLGDHGANALIGGAGADSLSGRLGDDRLCGGAGDDLLAGGGGDDLLEGGLGQDVALFAGLAPVRVTLRHDRPQDTGHGIDRLSGIEHLVAGSGGDLLIGDGAANRFEGRKGNDRLSGYGGHDTLLGGEGNDTLSGDTGDDVLASGSGIDTALFLGPQAVRVTLGLTGAQVTGQGRDWLIGVENLLSGTGNDRLAGDGLANRLDAGAGQDTLLGGGGRDTLLGGAAADRLWGGSGRDWLAGGSGDDLLWGDAGADCFVFSGGRDVVQDFDRAAGDRILLDDATLAAVRGMSAAQAIDAFGRDLGGSVALDFGGGHRLTLEGVADLSALGGVLAIL